jgi:hypothetical protein
VFVMKDFKKQISKFKKMENLADIQAWVENERLSITTKLFLIATLNWTGRLSRPHFEI